MADTTNKYNFLDYEGLSLFWNNVKKVIEDNELVTATALTNLDTRVGQLEDTGSNQGTTSNQIIAISYADLKALRDTAQLVPGQQYRITDYTCTTTQENTRAVGHVFDVIVTADDESTLNEVARAVKHDGDTYFAGCDLNVWKIWYCLDNDTTRFAWADSTNGKGVIYRMIDEFNNDIPYDFKNIQFKHPNDTTTYPHYYYTFASGNVEDNTDCSLNISSMCYSNTIKNNLSMGGINEHPMILNQIIFIGTTCVYNTFGYDCQTNSFGDFCGYNTFGNTCTDNTFGDGCVFNTFGDGCVFNTFGNTCSGNTFGNDYINNTFGSNYENNTFGSRYRNNTFGDNYQYNTFGSNYGNNIFGDNYQYNIFGNYCGSNTFGSSYTSNTFGNGISRNIGGNNCWKNSFGNACVDNTVGDNFQSNTLGNECAEITFGNDCSYNTFGNMCYQIKFASGSSTSATKYNYYQYNHFGDGCREILFKGAETASDSAQVQNYNFSQGLRSTSVGFLTVDGKRNRAFETKVARNSNGELKIYCEADLIQ